MHYSFAGNFLVNLWNTCLQKFYDTFVISHTYVKVLLHVHTCLSGCESDIWLSRYVFALQLFSLMDSKPPISRAKMISITKSAIKAIKVSITASKYESVRINLKSFNAAEQLKML